MNTTDRKKGFQTNGKRKNNLRIFQAESRGIFKNSQLQIIFTGCYEKKSVPRNHVIAKGPIQPMHCAFPYLQ